MSETKTTEMLNWIDEELVNISIMRDDAGDPYFEKQANMLAAIRNLLLKVAHAEELKEAGYGAPAVRGGER